MFANNANMLIILNPRRYFRQELERLDEGLRKEDMAVHVRRDHVFEDSYRELHRKSPEDMKNRL